MNKDIDQYMLEQMIIEFKEKAEEAEDNGAFVFNVTLCRWLTELSERRGYKPLQVIDECDMPTKAPLDYK